MAEKGIVAAGHVLTADAATQVLREGGNAFDAAIAATFMACVAEPVLSSLAGGGFMLARPEGGKPRLYDFFTQTPGWTGNEAELDFYASTVDFGSTTQDFHIGKGSIAVPGIVKGLFDIHAQLGGIPMSRLVEPAAEAARAGVELSSYQAYIFSLIEPIYLDQPCSRAIFESRLHPGRIAGEGEVIATPEYGDMLEVLAREGADLFYRGEIASEIERLCEKGGLLRRVDLERYRTAVREPLEFEYRDHQVFTNPPPSAGGLLIAFALELLEHLDVAGEGFGSASHLTALKEVMDLTNAARIESTVDDEKHWPLPELLFSPALLARYRDEVTGRVRSYRGTTQVTIIDRELNIASITVSNGEGCGHILPGAGIMLNNMLGEEDLNPGGFFRWQPNRRMSSMMAPTLVLDPDGGLIATGSGGSNRIRTAILQVLVNLLDFGMGAEEAVDAPRIHAERGELLVEGGFPETGLKQLLDRYPRHKIWAEKNMFFGGAHTVVYDGAGLSGAGDPRRGGVLVKA